MECTALSEWIRQERRAVVVVNARSRSGARLARHIRRALVRRGIEVPVIYPVRTPSRLSAVTHKAMSHGARLIVAGGGDGTIVAVVNALALHDYALGIVPTGTGNNIARTLGIPETVHGAAEVIAAGRVVEVDLGKIDGRYFVNAVAAGLTAQAVRLTPVWLKRYLGKLGYGLVGAFLLPRCEPFHCRVETEDRVVETEALVLVIANGRYFGDAVLSPEASILDGLLTVHLIEAAPILHLLPETIRYALLHQPGLPGRHHLTAREVRIVTDPVLLFDVDGEHTVCTPARFSVEPHALKVIVPPAVRTL